MTADPTVLDLADLAAEAVRDLNHRTRHADAFTGPSELYRLVGDLTLLVGGLPQLLGQLEGWLHAEHDAGRVRSDTHNDPGPAVSDAADDLAEAGDAARNVARALNGAHQHLAHLGSLTPPRPPHGQPQPPREGPRPTGRRPGDRLVGRQRSASTLARRLVRPRQ